MANDYTVGELNRRLERLEREVVTERVFEQALATIREDVREVKDALGLLRRQEEVNHQQNRTLVKGAIIAGVVNILVALVLFVVLR